MKLRDDENEGEGRLWIWTSEGEDWGEYDQDTLYTCLQFSKT